MSVTTSDVKSKSNGIAHQLTLIPDDIEDRLSRLKTIPYHPAMAHYLKSGDAALLLRQIWFYWKRDRSEFQRFIQPCNHPMYKDGRSWTEELDWSRHRFQKARLKLEEKGYISTRAVFNVLFWTLNEDKFIELLDTLLEETPSFSSDVNEVESLLKKVSQMTGIDLSQLLHIKNDNGVSFADILPNSNNESENTVYKLLNWFGVTGTNLKKYSDKSLPYVVGWMLRARENTGLSNPAGWVVKRFAQNEGLSPSYLSGITEYLNLTQDTLDYLATNQYQIVHLETNEAVDYLLRLLDAGISEECAYVFVEHHSDLKQIVGVING